MKPIEILLVDDCPDHVQLVCWSFRNYRDQVRMHCVGDGEQALRLLRPHRMRLRGAKPDLVLLDLGLPGIQGHEVLEQIRANPELRELPVVVFTASSNDDDIDLAYDLRVDSYLLKPAGSAEVEELPETILNLWQSQLRSRGAEPRRSLNA